MKKISLFFVFALMFVMTSCDKLDEPFKKEVNIEATGRVVLLEDYTGVRCVNCPAAAEIAHELQETFGESLVVMGVHAGSLSMPLTGYPDFRTEVGTAWYNYFGFQSNPIGTINRVKGDAGYGFNDGEWATKVAEELAKEQIAELDIVCNYNEQTRNLNVEVNTVFLQSQSGKYFVTACLVEDSIVGRQRCPEPVGVDSNYVHRHVFRGAINGTWGTEIFDGAVPANEEISTTCSITVDTTYNADNCYVVAFVYDDDDDANKYILQAFQKKIK